MQERPVNINYELMLKVDFLEKVKKLEFFRIHYRSVDYQLAAMIASQLFISD